MRASSFRYLVKTGVHNLWANRMMTVASVGTLIACLLIVGFAVLFSINVDSIVEYLGQQNEVVVFMQMDTPAEYMTTMEEELNSMEGLDEVVYVSSEEGFAEYKEGLGEDSYLLDGMEDEAAEILPAKFTAKIVDPEQVDAILASIRRMDYVDTAEAPTDLTKTLVSVRTMVNTIGGIVIAALVLVSLVIITNTIRASVFTRRKEISIMKYVGATNGFIRVPFIIYDLCGRICHRNLLLAGVHYPKPGPLLGYGVPAVGLLPAGGHSHRRRGERLQHARAFEGIGGGLDAAEKDGFFGAGRPCGVSRYCL